MAPIDLGLALGDRFDDAPWWVEPLAIVEVVSKELSIVGGFVRVMNLNTILWNVRSQLTKTLINLKIVKYYQLL